jgi:hypothetical protein
VAAIVSAVRRLGITMTAPTCRVRRGEILVRIAGLPAVQALFMRGVLPLFRDAAM